MDTAWLKSLIEVHRKRLAVQWAAFQRFGDIKYIPPHMINEFHHDQAEIAKIKAQLKTQNIAVENQELDTLNVEEEL